LSDFSKGRDVEVAGGATALLVRGYHDSRDTKSEGEGKGEVLLEQADECNNARICARKFKTLPFPRELGNSGLDLND
jgi:hypothetical protein